MESPAGPDESAEGDVSVMSRARDFFHRLALP